MPTACAMGYIISPLLWLKALSKVTTGMQSNAGCVRQDSPMGNLR